MRKNIVVGEFHDGYAPYLVGGRKEVDRMKRIEPEQFIQEKRIVVEIPGTILGTPEDWDIMFNNEMNKVFYK